MCSSLLHHALCSVSWLWNGTVAGNRISKCWETWRSSCTLQPFSSNYVKLLLLFWAVTMLTSTAVECIDVLNVTWRESITLTKRTELYTGVHRLNGGLSIAGECEGTVVHDGAQVIGDTLCSHKRWTGNLKVVLLTWNSRQLETMLSPTLLCLICKCIKKSLETKYASLLHAKSYIIKSFNYKNFLVN